MSTRLRVTIQLTWGSFIKSEILMGRYEILKKIGFGHFSTVWLARDITCLNYVAVKIAKACKETSEAALDEIDVLQRMNQKLANLDSSPIVRLINSFIHFGSNGKHVCLVFELMGVNLLEIFKRYRYRGIPIFYVKRIVKQLLVALDFIHRECGIIHTDIKPENILVALRDSELEHVLLEGDFKNEIYSEDSEDVDKETLRKKKKTEKKKKLKQKRKQKKKLLQMGFTDDQANKTLLKFEHSLENITRKCNDAMNSLTVIEKVPRPRIMSEHFMVFNPDEGYVPSVDLDVYKKECAQYVDFLQEKAKKAKLTKNVQVKLTDFGNACWKNHKFSSLIQTRQYRSPEVLLGLNYSEKTDIWSLGCLVFEMITGDYLFDPKRTSEYNKNEDHLASMIEHLGKLPVSMTERSKVANKLLSDTGKMKNIHNFNYVSITRLLTEKYKISEEESNRISNFLLKMLKFNSEERQSAQQLLDDAWLNGNYTEVLNEKSVCIKSNLVDSDTSEKFEADVEDNSSYGLDEEESSSDCVELIKLDNFNNSFAEYGEFIQMECDNELNQFKRIIEKIKAK